MRWQIRLTPALHKFFTGDNPIYWTDLREPNATLLFPISSNALFCASSDQTTPEVIFLEKNYKFVVKIREAIAQQCEELYFSMEAKWLVDFLNER